MTTVVAMRFGLGLVIAADRRVTNGLMGHTSAVPKILVPAKKSDWAIGVAGTLHAQQMLRQRLGAGDGKTIDALAERITSIIKVDCDGDDCEILIVHQGSIYTLFAAGELLETVLDYAAVGSGSAFAMGALHQIYEPSMRRSDSANNVSKVAAKALNTAATFDVGTAGPFDVVFV